MVSVAGSGALVFRNPGLLRISVATKESKWIEWSVSHIIVLLFGIATTLVAVFSDDTLRDTQVTPVGEVALSIDIIRYDCEASALWK